MVRRAIFLSGFHNWGKSTIIKSIFNQSYRNLEVPGQIFTLWRQNFLVQHKSNDDYPKSYLTLISNELTLNKNEDLFTTLCPSMEPKNKFTDILSNQVFHSFQELYLLLIEYKWENHAKLITSNIEKEINSIKTNLQIKNKNICSITINSQDNDTKLQQITTEIKKIYGI